METINIKPAALFAFFKIIPFLIAALGFVWLAWHYWPGLIWLAGVSATFAVYRYLYVRRIRYIITTEYLQVNRGLFFRRVDTIELFRVKDYTLEQPFVLQILRLMDLQLLTTDPINPVVWLRGIPLSDLVDQLRERVLETRRHNRIYEIN
ncbi:MAG: PH domain-containing protein [Mucilaginibacter sp.]